MLPWNYKEEESLVIYTDFEYNRAAKMLYDLIALDGMRGLTDSEDLLVWELLSAIADYEDYLNEDRTDDDNPSLF